MLFLIAGRSLLQHKRRTFMLGGAIAGVMALLVLLLGVSVGMRQNMITSATTLMTGHVNVGGFFKITAGQSAPVVTGFRKILEQVKHDVPEIEYVTHRGRGWAKVVSDTASVQVGLAGVDIADEPGMKRVLQIQEGRIDDLAKRGSMLIFEEQAKKLGVKVGDQVTISAPTFKGTNNTLDVTIVAVAENVGLMSSFSTFIDAPSLRALYQLNEDTTGALLLYLRDMNQVQEVQQRLRTTLAKAGYGVMDNNPVAFWMKFQTVNREDWTGQRLDITNWEDEISFMKWSATALTVLSFVLISILLIIICVGIMNIMWITIRERTREIGTLRAIGMQRMRVLAMFVTEGFLIGLVGTVVGSLLGLVMSFGLNAARVPLPAGVRLFLMTNHLVVHPPALGVAQAAVVITVCITLISLIPSFLAARMKPITAMSHIG